jgi:hypothetical protein
LDDRKLATLQRSRPTRHRFDAEERGAELPANDRRHCKLEKTLAEGPAYEEL